MTDIPMNVFIPLEKIDVEKRLLYGWGSLEEGDAADEIMDYASSKPLFQQWVGGAQKRSGGKSYGNVRAMHQPIAAGKLVSFTADDQRKGFHVVAKIVDDGEWRKVQEGIYTGFSIGGSYVRRWPDRSNPGLTRYTAKPAEISIVDNPCVAGATFDVIKADGMTIKQPFKQPIQLDSALDNLVKSLPGVPEPVVTMSVGSMGGAPFHVEQLPNHITPMEVEPGDKPGQEVLQQHAVPSVDISSEIDKLMPKIQKMMEEQFNLLLTKLEESKAPPAEDDVLLPQEGESEPEEYEPVEYNEELSTPAGEMIKVVYSTNMIKVV